MRGKRKQAAVLAAVLAVLALLGSMAAEAATAASYLERSPAVLAAPDITLSGGGDYTDGYIDFAVSGGTSTEALGLKTDNSASTANGAVSIVGTSVYLGDGSTARVIGTVDGTYDGQDGRKLRVNFSSPLTNASFDEGFSNGQLPGWSVYNRHVTGSTWNLTDAELFPRTQARAYSSTSGTSAPYTINGPGYSYTSDRPYNSGANAYEADLRAPSGTLTWATSILNGALRLYSAGNIMSPNGSTYGSIFGPEVVSDPFYAYAGDSLALDWRASGSGDDYEVYGYLIDIATNARTLLFYGRGDTQAWTTSSGSIPAEGTYRFHFINGSYDNSGGYYVGAEFFIDNIRVYGSGAGDAVATAIARRLTYYNSGCDPALSRTIDVSAKTASGTMVTASAYVNITPVNCAPTLTASGSNPSYKMGETAKSLFGSVSVDAREAAQSITGLDLTVSGVVDGSGEKLVFDGTAIPLVSGESGTTSGNGFSYSVSGSSPLSVSISKAAGAAQNTMASLVDAMAYKNEGNPPTPGSRTITLKRISDDGGTANGGVDSSALNIASQATVLKADQTITFNALGSKTYGDSSFTLAATASSGLPVSYASSDTSVATVDSSGTVSVVGAGTTSITASQAGDTCYSPASSVSRTLTVDKKALTAALSGNPTKTYDGNAAAALVPSNYTLEGLVGTDSITVNQTAGAYDSKDAGTRTVTAILDGTHYTAARGSLDNYVLPTAATGSGTIEKRPLVVTGFAADNKVYDGTTTATGSFATDVLSGENIQVVYSAAFDTKDYGTGKTVSFTNMSLAAGGDNDNYVLATTTGTSAADITKRPLTVTLVDKAKTYGTLDPVFTATYDSTEHGGMGFAEGDDVTAIGNLVIYREQGNNAGAYPIRYQIFNELNHSYSLTMVEGTFTISPKALLLSEVLAQDKVYDATTAAAGTLVVTGMLQEDDVQAAGTFAFADKHAGTDKVVLVTGIGLTGSMSGNYTLAETAQTTADITRKAVTATATADDKVYDGTAAGTGTIFLEGTVPGDELDAAATFTFAEEAVGTWTVAATGIALTGADSGNYSVNPSAEAEASIAGKVLTATATADDKVYDGTTAGSGTISLSGVSAGDDVTASGTFIFEDKDAAADRAVLVTEITLTGADSANYTVNTTAAAAAAIEKRPLTMTAENKSKLYGEGFDPVFTVAWDGLQNGETTADLDGSYTVFREVGEAAGDYDIWIISSLSSNNYDITLYDGNNNDSDGSFGTFTIEKRPLTITAASASKTYDGTPIEEPGYTAAGVLAEGEVLESATVAGSQLYAGSSTNAAVSAVVKKGTKNVTANYEITYVPGTLTVKKAAMALYVVSDSGSKTYDGTPLMADGWTYTGTLAAGDSLDVVVTGSRTEVGSSANTIASVAVLHGDEQVDVTENYTITTSEGTLAVTDLSITITADSATRTYDGTPLTAGGSSLTSGELLAGHSFTAVTSGAQLFTGTAANSIASVRIEDGSGADVTGNYDITTVAGALTVETASIALHVAADTEGKTYDGMALEGNWTCTGTLATGDSLDVVAAGSQTDAGSSANTIVSVAVLNGTVDVTENYVVTTEAGLLTVAKAELTATVGDYSRTYGEENPSFEVVLEGFVNGESAEAAAGFMAPVAVTDASAASSVDDYTIRISGGEALNYTFDTADEGTLTVEARPIALAADNKAKYEGRQDPELTYAIASGSLVAGDAVTGSLTRESGEERGTYRILQGSLAIDGNYAITFLEGAFTIRSTPSSGGSSSLGSNEPEGEAVIVLVNGEEEEAGQTDYATDGSKTTLNFTVDKQALDRKVDEVLTGGSDDNTVTFPISDGDVDAIHSRLTGDMVKKLETGDFKIVVDTQEVAFELPAREVGIDKAAAALGVEAAALDTIEVAVVISRSDAADAIKAQAEANGQEMVLSAYTFEVVAETVTQEGEIRMLAVKKFTVYVPRVLEIPEGVDPSRITTGIVYNADGTFSHIPTVVYEEDGVWYAKLQSLTNSDYSVIWNPVEVASVKGHWSEEAVNDMASRLVVGNPESFDPEGHITRAEFAEYITKALGIYRTGVARTDLFTDIPAGHAQADAITLASEYSIVNGYPDGAFDPNALITRQEAMVMYARAMKVAGLASIDGDRILGYMDQGQVAEWAYESVRQVLGAHVFNGTSATTISPGSTFRYAEAATAIRNLLTEAGLID